ncbi:MAG: cupredoxin domain-containing protein [Magnetococcales bacterium]|nr:cupredoxin domain-containing protein [Magnetococcales bacterium]
MKNLNSVCKNIMLVFALMLLLTPPVWSGDDYVRNAKEIVKAADWKTMKTVTIEIDEHSYDPEKVVFKVGQPYKLELKNVGEKKHYFTAPEFYRSIATRKVQANRDGEIKAPYFLALEMMANGGQLDIYFVPVKKGSYVVYCTIDDHRQEGMEGMLVIN